MRDPVKAIVDFNRRFTGRYPPVLRRKLKLLCESPFAFFRGTFHLFCEDWLRRPEDPAARDLRIVADVHGENFGAYGGEQRRTELYGINDFDEETTGTFDFDVSRAATSVLLAAAIRNLPERDGVAGAEALIQSYVDVLGGAPFPPDPQPIRKLLRHAREVKRPDFIRKHTRKHGGGRRFDDEKCFTLHPEHRNQALRLLADYRTRPNASVERDAAFYEVEDVQGYAGGCGSLGRLRYVILLRGKGTEEARNTILDFKEALPSALDLARGRRAGSNRAREVADATRLFQGESDPFLGYARDDGASFQVRQISPREKRLSGEELATARGIREVAATYGAHLAASHRRANRGAAAQLRAFSFRRTLAFALAYSEQVEEDWRALKRRRPEATAALVPGT